MMTAPRLEMAPATGERLLRFVGDRICFKLVSADGKPLPDQWRGLLRANLGRGSVLREEIIASRGGGKSMSGSSWRDIPMRRVGDEWTLELTLTEVGYFKAKAYAVDPQGWQIWPEGPDIGISIHPDAYRTANTIYCAFTRLFGERKIATTTTDKQLDAQLKPLDKQGYTVIPPSGKLRELIEELPHIIDTLGCRILHLLPINPTPTTYARFGRAGSPYAGLDLTAIDPALIDFDRRTTGVAQFCELASAVHGHGARLFLDLVINHTGWSSTLHENHPEWFLRDADGAFVSPGAWGVIWEDLVELNTRETELWDHLAEAFLTWCRRGVDGFRCDAGYKVPMPVWQYIVARVREEFPETLLLLEGLGGAWTETEALLTEGGMQWAYSELFQEYSGLQVAGYLDHAHKQSERVGVLAHYSETHDNERLAKKGRAWSLLRNRLCALASVNGAFGFTCGVEWLATERVLVHGCTGLAWGSAENIIPELARLSALISHHPCFLDRAVLKRLSPPDSTVFALQRVSADGQDVMLVLANTDIEKDQALTIALDAGAGWPQPVPARRDTIEAPRPALSSLQELLGQPMPKIKQASDGKVTFALPPGACYCLAPTAQPRGLTGDAYRRERAQAAWAIHALKESLGPEEIGPFDWRALAELAARDPIHLLGSLSHLDKQLAREDLLAALKAATEQNSFPSVVTWSLIDRRRIMLVPLNHWLVVRDDAPFRVTLRFEDGLPRHAQSIVVRNGHIACFLPRAGEADAALLVERFGITDPQVTGAIRFVANHSDLTHRRERAMRMPKAALVLLTNGTGGMARLCVDLGRVNSKYDCLLGANLNANLPVDRHVFAKRVRVWANVNGFISPLNLENLVAFEPGPPAHWRFVANAGDGSAFEIRMTAEMRTGQNTSLLRFTRPRDTMDRVPAAVRLTVRVDIEDRNFHSETKRNPAAEHHFSANTRPLPNPPGFAFTPAPDRQLRVFCDAGEFHPESEWCENIPHPVEASRGQLDNGDAYSPGWFDLSLAPDATRTLVVTAEKEVGSFAFQSSATQPEADDVKNWPRLAPRKKEESGNAARPQFPSWEGPGVGSSESAKQLDSFLNRLLIAAKAFVVRRGEGKTVIAGYPWFLDWGRDTLICARGLLAAGMVEDVKQIILTFARFEEKGTLPNTIHGEDARNRDTSDAPLWFGIVCEELAELTQASGLSSDAPNPSQAHGTRPHPLSTTIVDRRGRTIVEVLSSIAGHYRAGTPNGIRMDEESALIWSPSHFTWMDTNFPAATPREGYPIEIQVLWIRLLRQLERIGATADRQTWAALADRAAESLERYFWLDDPGYYADLLIAGRGKPAAAAIVDTALRSNGLLAVSLGLVTGERAQSCVDAALRYLVVPGALRSLAPVPVSPPLPVYGGNGHLLNNPVEPYQGRYEGDEDTRRKVAYHNGTAWTWTFPVFCEALARAWNFSPHAIAAAKAYLGSMERLMNEGCLGQLPEILDGDAPHQSRGCDAQAWGVTEALRVCKLLDRPS